MTVSISERLSPLYEGNGINTRYDFTFRVFDQEDANGVSVKHQVGADFEKIDESLYTVTINPDNLGGYVNFLTAPVVGFEFYIAGETPVDQLLDITNYDNFYPDAIERSLDKLTAILQEWAHSLGFEKLSREKALEILDLALQEQIREQGIAMDQIDSYAKDLAESIKNIVIQRGWLAELIVYGDMTQKEVNDYQIGTVNYDLYNTPEKYGADSEALDNSVALQAWANSGKLLHFRPGKIYKHSQTLNLSIANQSIIGLSFNKYAASGLQYTGTGIALKATTNIGYPHFSGWQLIGTISTAGAVFEVGTVGIDMMAGGSIDAQNWFVNGFETIAKSSGNTFYNRFINCRFSDFRNGFDGFASYNLQFLLCRFYRFTDAIRTVGGAGPINIKFSTFEQFNGAIHRSNNDKCELNFTDNYVEMFDKVLLPTNFVKAANQTKGNYFSGNILFLGYYSKFNENNNKFSLGGVFRIAAFSECDYLISEGNVISLYDFNNNMQLMFTNNGTYKSVSINDTKYGSLGVDGAYDRAYSRSSFNNFSNLRNRYYYYDCILDATQPLVNRLIDYSVLLNGWTVSPNSGGTKVSALALEDGGLRIYGSVDGGAKTANTILNIPATHRPKELGVSQSFILFQVSSSNGTSVPVVLRYYYSTGALELFTNPTILGNLLINIVIPPRI